MTAASVAFADPKVSGTNVIVAKDPDGTVVYKGKLDARGTFSTPKVPPGPYAVLFRAKEANGLKGDKFSVGVAGGKEKMIASGVAAISSPARGLA